MGNIFISHIEQEAAFAKVLKDWLGKTTAGGWNVFVGSDPECIPPGMQRPVIYDAALMEHRLLIALCSPASIRQIWIGYETGFGAGRKVPIIPICHSGATRDELPSFLSVWQNITYPSKDFVRKLYAAVFGVLPLAQPPYIPEMEILRDIEEALSIDDDLRPSPPLSHMLVTEIEIKNPESREILRQLALAFPESFSLRSMAGILGELQIKVQSYFDELHLYELVEIVPGPPGEMMYGLTPAGRKYVITKGMIKVPESSQTSNPSRIGK